MGTIDRTIGNYHDSSNARIRKIGRYVGPSSYVAGGDPLTPAEVGLGKIEAILFEIAIDPALTGDFQLSYDHTNQKVVWWSNATGVEVAGAVDLSTYAARFEAIGY
jgi:hypothetical protein